MNVIAFFDCHCDGADPMYSCTELVKRVGAAILDARRLNAIILLGGDNFDVKNSKNPEQTKKAKTALYEMVRVSGVPNLIIEGNHDGNKSLDSGRAITSFCLELLFLHHGDEAFYGMTLASQRRDYVSGCGSFMRFLKWIGSMYRRITGWRLNEKREDALVDMKNKYCRDAEISICGHTHPKKMQSFAAGGCTYFVFPRGETRVSI